MIHYKRQYVILVLVLQKYTFILQEELKKNNKDSEN